MNHDLGEQLLAIGFLVLTFVAFAVLPFLPRYVADADEPIEKPDPNPEVPRWTL